MLKSTMDKLSNAVNGIWSYSCHCCMSKRDKPIYRRTLRKRLKAMLHREMKQETPTNN